MRYPDFFDAAPVIAMRDPLAEFLGAAQNGVLEYRYADAVALAGHSCPTVAIAFLMTRVALKTLYHDGLPVRGAISVAFRDDQLSGTTGVMANVVSWITGATQETGFKGIGGRFDRRHLLAFNTAMDAEIRFTRTDSGVAADVSAQLDQVPMHPRVKSLLHQCLTGEAGANAVAEFRSLWQDRVRTLLLDHKDDSGVIVVRVDRGFNAGTRSASLA